MILTVTLNAAIDKVYQVDSFEVDKVFRTTNMWQTAGGKGLNVSRVATILGSKVTASGFLGGRAGDFISEQIEKEGIIDGFAATAGETRTCIAINDSVKGTSTEVLESGPEISQEEREAFIEKYKKLVKDASIIALSGSLPRGVPADFYGTLIDIGREQGEKVILDTSGPALEAGIKHKPYMIKPNINELEALVGKSLNKEGILDAARDIHKAGVELVCITLGSEGCIAVTNEGAFRLQPPKVDAINAVGSGDSFVAGCAISLSQNKAIIDVLKTGIACGTANTQFEATGMVSPELVEEFINKVQVESLD